MKKTKEHIKSLNRKYIINLSVLIFLSLLIFTSCKNEQKQHFLYSNIDKSSFFQLIYFENKIVLIYNSSFNNIKRSDTSILIKRKGEYFCNYKGTTIDKELLMMSISKDTIYNYKNMGKTFFSRISEIGNKKFKSETVNADSLRFKLRTTFYYDNKYNIIKIEEDLNDKITKWE
jgi:hypothetical protein